MNTRNFNINYLVYFLLVVFVSCTKEKQSTKYVTTNKAIYGTEINKNKLKTEAQFLSILSTDLTQLPISPSKLNRAVQVLESIGDRETANEIIISNYMNDPTLSIPPDTYMREHLTKFITETYNKFFIRNPSQAELAYFTNYISSNPKITVEMVYTAFASSQEYMYY
jgi:hypothetical protein